MHAYIYLHGACISGRLYDRTSSYYAQQRAQKELKKGSRRAQDSAAADGAQQHLAALHSVGDPREQPYPRRLVHRALRGNGHRPERLPWAAHPDGEETGRQARDRRRHRRRPPRPHPHVPVRDTAPVLRCRPRYVARSLRYDSGTCVYRVDALALKHALHEPCFRGAWLPGFCGVSAGRRQPAHRQNSPGPHHPPRKPHPRRSHRRLPFEQYSVPGGRGMNLDFDLTRPRSYDTSIME